MGVGSVVMLGAGYAVHRFFGPEGVRKVMIVVGIMVLLAFFMMLQSWWSSGKRKDQQALGELLIAHQHWDDQGEVARLNASVTPLIPHLLRAATQTDKNALKLAALIQEEGKKQANSGPQLPDFSVMFDDDDEDEEDGEW